MIEEILPSDPPGKAVGYLFSYFGVGRYVKCLACGAEQAELFEKHSRPRIVPITNPYLRALFPNLADAVIERSKFRGYVRPLHAEDVPWPHRQTCSSCGVVLVEGAGSEAPLWISRRGSKPR